MKRHSKKLKQEAAEMDITAFMNLMVILIPFLLITAVFSRLTVLELNLPPINAKANSAGKIKLQLELVVRPNAFDIQDANLGVIKHFSRTEDNTNWKAFSDILVEIKRRFPNENNITLLLSKKVKYKTLIAVMDRVRSADIIEFTSVETVELFPNISIGDAPVLNSPTSMAQTVSSK